MLPGLTAPVLAAAALLALAAPAKLRRPAPAVTAMRAAGLPSAPWVVRALGAGELALAAAVLLTPSRWVLAALAAAYLGFAAFVALLRHRGEPLSSCGCFGRPDTPATGTHVVVVALVGAVAAAAAVTTGAGSLPDVVGTGPWAGVPLLATAVVTTGLLWAVLSVLPAVQAARALSATPQEAR